MPGRRSTHQPGCIPTCLGIALLIFFLPVLVPLVFGLMSLLVLAGVLAVVPVGLLLVWQSNWSLRTKRAVTGTLVPPVGAYYLFRYTGLDHRIKLGAIAAALIGVLLLPQYTSAGLLILLVLGLTFLGLFLSVEGFPMTSAGPRLRPKARKVPRDAIPKKDLRGLLEIEEAQSAPERRLLVAREFGRLAQWALTALPSDQSSWPVGKQLTALRAEIEFLRMTVSDPASPALPETSPGDALTMTQLAAALRDLDGYVTRLAGARSSKLDLEELRLLTRERGRLQRRYDEVMHALMTPMPDPPETDSGEDTPPIPPVTPRRVPEQG